MTTVTERQLEALIKNPPALAPPGKARRDQIHDLREKGLRIGDIAQVFRVSHATVYGWQVPLNPDGDEIVCTCDQCGFTWTVRNRSRLPVACPIVKGGCGSPDWRRLTGGLGGGQQQQRGAGGGR